MKLYVDELPVDCIECPFCKDIKVNVGMDRLLFCKANKGKVIKNIEKSFNKCIVKNEFQSLTDYTKQVRKEMCDEIRQNAISHNNLEVDMYYITPQQLYEIEQGETNGSK